MSVSESITDFMVLVAGRQVPAVAYPGREIDSLVGVGLYVCRGTYGVERGLGRVREALDVVVGRAGLKHVVVEAGLQADGRAVYGV
ncbi:MAG: hypothetical protein ACI35Q_03525 [Marinilabiliaceae bacterium]